MWMYIFHEKMQTGTEILKQNLKGGIWLEDKSLTFIPGRGDYQASECQQIVTRHKVTTSKKAKTWSKIHLYLNLRKLILGEAYALCLINSHVIRKIYTINLNLKQKPTSGVIFGQPFLIEKVI